MERTFEEIYENEADAIFRFCLVKLSDREQALDVTQETFLRLWQNWQDSKKIGKIRAFLFTVAGHLVIDWYRKKKSFSLDKMIEESENYDVPDEKVSEKNFFLKAEGRYLAEKINELTPAYRDPVYFRYVEELSPPEIGEILGISANLVSVRINRGIDELRKKTGYYNEIN